MKLRDTQYIVIFLVIFLLSLVTDWYRFLTISSFVVVLYFSIEKMGRAIILRELIALHFVFICLFMPLMGYLYFNQNNYLARLWMRFMFISENEYFSYALPATIAFVIAICWPLTDSKVNDYTDGLMPILEKAKISATKNKYAGPILLVFGIIMYSVSNALPEQFQFAFQLFYFASFAGFLYVYYQKSFKLRIPLLLLFTGYILFQTLASAMFTIVAYMGITLSSFLFLNKTISIYKKLLTLFLSLFMLFLIQSVKIEYRKHVWGKEYSGNPIALYGELLGQKITTLGDVETDKMFFPIYYRTNQGFNVALVMNRFPRVADFDNGKKLGVVVASSFIPRFLWPNKPTAGGKDNMQYYAGVQIRGYSTNVGPLGEAYGSFGKFGGIFYLFVLGVFIRWAYYRIFIIAQHLPLIIFWIPVLFFQISYSGESDSLQILNSLIKSAFFIWLLYRLFPRLFGR